MSRILYSAKMSQYEETVELDTRSCCLCDTDFLAANLARSERESVCADLQTNSGSRIENGPSGAPSRF